MKKFYIFFLTFIVLSNVSFAQEEQSSPEQQDSSVKTKMAREEVTPQTAEIPTEEHPATPLAEPTASSVQASTETQTETTVAQPTIPVTPTEPVEFEQKTWEKSEAVELEKEDSIPLTKNETTEKIVRQAQEINQIIQTAANQILKKREETYSKYAQLDGKLDIFLQETSILEGQFKVKISKAEEQEKLATDPNKKIELELYKRDWEQLKTDVEKVDGIENQLIEELKKIDGKVDEALDNSINAKKINLAVLKASNEQDAQAKLNQLKELQEKCISLQNSLSTDFLNKIDSLSSQIQNEIQTLQARTKKLEEKAKELKILEESTLIEKKTNEIKTSEKQVIPPTQNRYLYTKTVAATAWFINFSTSTKNWFKNLIFGKTPKKTKLNGEKSKINTETKEETIKNLEEEKTKIAQQTQNLKNVRKKRQEQQQKIQNNIQSTETIKPEQTQEQKETTQIKKSAWRIETEHAFEKFLDGITWLIEKTKYYSKSLYDKHAKEKITTFVTDIHAKIEELKKEEKGKANQTPAHEQPTSEQKIDIKQKQSEATEASELGPVTEEEEKGSIPTAKN